MRILLATDASRSADRARDLIAALPLPAGSVVRAVAVFQRPTRYVGPPLAATFALEESETDRQQLYTLETGLEAVAQAISRTGVKVERFVASGRPASVVIEESRAFQPDLIVVGSRGHGRFESMLLGSVSSEIVDHAPCPVLVVRRDTIDGILFAEDGSESASSAREVLTAWPIFRGIPVTIVTVLEREPIAGGAYNPGVTVEQIDAWRAAMEQDRERHEELARQSAAAFGEHVQVAGTVVREGDAAHEIVEVARERGVGMIVAGTRGHTGIRRLLLGSVARNVLLHAPCNVLIVREKTVVHHDEPANEVTTA